MRFIEPSVSLFPEVPVDGLLQRIELCGRVCYKSEDKITAESAPKFVANIIKMGHESVLEHVGHTFKVFKQNIPDHEGAIIDLLDVASNTEGMRYSEVKDGLIVTMNVRTLRDAIRRCPNDLVTDLACGAARRWPELYGDIAEDLTDCEPRRDITLWDGLNLTRGLPPGEWMKHISRTVRFINDRGVSHEEVRHRIASFSQESTRYCNYGKGEVAFIDAFPGITDRRREVFDNALAYAEKAYKELLEMGVTPQMARSVLPNALKTELVVTMTLRAWRHFFKLRTSEKAHPQMQEVAKPLLEMFRQEHPLIFTEGL